MKSLTRSLIAATVVTASLGVFAVPAHATLQPLRVYQGRCAAPCPESARVSSGGVVYKDIQLVSEGSSNQWVEIKLRKGSGNWFCIHRNSNPGSHISIPWSTTSIRD